MSLKINFVLFLVVYIVLLSYITSSMALLSSSYFLLPSCDSATHTTTQCLVAKNPSVRPSGVCFFLVFYTV